MYHLYLTTHDPNGALRMNKIMREADFTQHHLRWQLKYARMTQQQMGLFAPADIAPPVKQPSRDEYVSEIAVKIIRAFSGRTANRRQVYHHLADELYLTEEINRALTQLKKEGKINFDGSVSALKNSSNIQVY